MSPPSEELRGTTIRRVRSLKDKKYGALGALGTVAASTVDIHRDHSESVRETSDQPNCSIVIEKWPIGAIVHLLKVSV